MIASLQGQVERAQGSSSVVIVAHGVGLAVEVPLPLLADLRDSREVVQLAIHTLIRPESWRLFGFRTEEERDVFALLIGLNGVGPKVALGILSTLTVPALHDAAQRGDTAAFTRVPGIGAKTAEKIVFELQRKLKVLPSALFADRGAAVQEDLSSALRNLGFRDPDIRKALARVEGDDFAAGLRLALAELAPPPRPAAGREPRDVF